MKKIFLSAIIILVTFSFAFGQEINKKNYKTKRITSAPEINGILDDEA